MARQTKQQWYKILDRLKHNFGVGTGPFRILLWGPPGTGKSTWPVQAAKSMGTSWSKIPMDKVEREDLVGGMMFNDKGETVSNPQFAAKEMQRGGMVILDEIDRTPTDVLGIVQAILDDPEIARLPLADGRSVSPADGFCVFATSNVEPSMLKDTIRDRFDLILYCGEPSPGIVSDLPKELAGILERQAVPTSNWTPPITVRTLQSTARLTKTCKMSMEEALATVYGPDVGNQLNDSIVASEGNLDEDEQLELNEEDEDNDDDEKVKPSDYDNEMGNDDE